MNVKSYFGLHPVSPCDELSVTSSFLGQPIDKSRTGPFPNPKRETPAIQQFGFYTHIEHGTYSGNCVGAFFWFHLWEPEFCFTRFITSLVFPTSPSVKTNSQGGEFTYQSKLHITPKNIHVLSHPNISLRVVFACCFSTTSVFKSKEQGVVRMNLNIEQQEVLTEWYDTITYKR